MKLHIPLINKKIAVIKSGTRTSCFHVRMIMRKVVNKL